MNNKFGTFVKKINWKIIFRITIVIVCIAVLIHLSFLYIFSKNYVTGPSMEPNFNDGDTVFTYRHAQLHRGDVVILKAPDKKNKLYIKRIIGMPGDKVECRDEQMYINGHHYRQKFLDAGQNYHEPESSAFSGVSYSYTYSFNVRSLAQAPYWQNVYNKPYLNKLIKSNRVPQNNYFVMGDHRVVSRDSRIFGFVDADEIVGKVICKVPFKVIA